MYFALQYATFEEISARADTITNVSFGKSTDALFNYGPLITSLVKVVNAPPPLPARADCVCDFNTKCGT